MKKLIILFISIAALSCGNNTEEYHINKGSITLAADESIKPIIQAEVEAYKAHYPEVEIITIYLPEQQAVRLMMQDSAEVIAITRELTPDEQRYFTSRKIPYEPAKMALDAVTLIVNKNSTINELSLEELKDILIAQESPTKIVFDNNSSSNLVYIKNLFQIENINTENIFAANGTLDAINYVQSHSNAIGVIGNNWISDEDNENSKKIRDEIKVLSIKDIKNNLVLPTLENIKQRKYPLERKIFLHTSQIRWGVGKGFVRFSCSQIGQLVVEKMGLMPYYIIPKTYILDKSKI